MSYRCYNCYEKKQVHDDICSCGTPGDNLDLKIRNVFSNVTLDALIESNLIDSSDVPFIKKFLRQGYKFEAKLTDKKLEKMSTVDLLRSRRRGGVRMIDGEAVNG